MKLLFITLASVLFSLRLEGASVHIVIDVMDLVPIDDTTIFTNSTPRSVAEVTNLRDTTGAVVPGIRMIITGFGISGNSNLNVGTWNGGYNVGLFTPDMAQDYIWNEGSGGNIRILGLDPDFTYDIRWLAARSDFGAGCPSRCAIYSANGTSPDGFAPTQSFNAHQRGWQNGEILQWTGLSPDSSGTIRIDANGTNNVGSYAYLNALEIVIIPEPATGTLAVLGLLALTTFRRRAHTGRRGPTRHCSGVEAGV